MSLYENFSRFGGGSISGIPTSGGGDNEKSLEEVQAEKTFEMNFEMLYRELPDLAQADPDTIIAIAKGSGSAADAIEAGLRASSAVQINNMLERLRDASKEEQRGAAANMPAAKREALVAAGWQIPQAEDEGGLWNRIKSAGGTVMRPVAATVGFGMKLPVISQGLKAMDYAAEEASRLSRWAPIAQSGGDLLDQTGMSQQELFQKTGISTPGGDIQGDPMAWSPAVALSQVLAGKMPSAVVDPLRHPGDLWKAVQTWDQIGHEGDDDYLPQLQYQVWQDLEEGLGQGNGKDALRFAKAMAAGATLDEIAAQEGKQGDEAEQFKQEVGMLSTTDAFRNAMNKLEGGRTSFGRNIARQVLNDPIADTRTGRARYLSGSLDAVYSVAIDPTMVVGAGWKAGKAAKWGIKAGDSLERLERWQQGARIIEKSAKGLQSTATARTALSVLSKKRYLRGTEAEMTMVYRPAAAVQEALKTGNWGKLIEQHPQFMRSVEDIKDFNANLKAAGLTGMEDDVGQVFEFYKAASKNRNVLRGPLDGTFDYSTKLFGHDGRGHLFVPRLSRKTQATLNAKGALKSVLLGSSDEIPQSALDDLKAAADEAHVELAKEAGRDVDEAIAETAEMEIDRFTGSYVAKRPNVVQRQLNQLYTLFSTPTTKEQAIHLVGNLSTEDFDTYNRMLGHIERANPAELRSRFNAFVNGTEAERHLLVQDMTNKAITSVGLTNTKEGRELLMKYGMHENHIYGHIDALKSNRIAAQADETSAARLLTRNAIHTGQNSLMMQVPSMKELVIAARKTAGLRWIGGHLRKSHLEAAMTNVWKPGSIMKLGFPLRAGFDEALLHVMRNGSWRYIKTQTLDKWSGIKGGTIDEAGRFVRKGEGAIKPIKTFTRFMSNASGGTDRAIAERAIRQVSATREFAAAGSEAAERAMLEKAVKDAIEAHGKGTIGKLPYAMRAMADFYDLKSLQASKLWTTITRDSKLMKRSEWADFMLRHNDDYARRKMLYAQVSWHPQFQIEQAEVIGHTFHGLTPNRSTDGLGSLTKVYSPSTDSGWQALPLKKDPHNGWEWVGDDDLSMKYLNLGTTMEKMAQTPETRAAIFQLRHHVPQRVLDEVGGLDGLHALRDSVSFDEEMRKLLARGASSEADAESVRATIAMMEFSDDTLNEIEPILAAWDDMSLDTRQFITDNTLVSGMLTDDMDLVQNRAANAAYNALRRLDHQTNLRSLIRGQVVDNKLVARTLKEGHLRVYSPMVDRRTAEEIIRLFSDQDMMETFAQRLREQLSSRGLTGQMDALWSAAPVNGDQGYTMASWMAGLKASIAQGDGSYMNAMMAGSSNYAVAEALRDALTDVLPEAMLRPTVGFFDFPQEALRYRNSGIKQVNDTVVSLQPHHRFEAIDPDQAVRQVHVQMANGDKLWVGDKELSAIGRVARMEDVSFASTWGSDRMTFFDPKTKTVKFNSKLMNQDYREGMQFLRGEAGHFVDERATWGWADPEYSDMARQLEAHLNSLGLAENVNATLDDMIGWQRMRRLHGDAPIPLEGAMKDNDLWDDFLELANSAKRSGRRTVREWDDVQTATQSQIAKAALDELGLNLDELGLTRRQYKSVLIERERAHRALDPAGFGRPRTISREAIEREKDALAVAFQRAGVDVPASVTERMKLAIGKEQNDYRVIGEIWGNGVTEDAAVRRASQHILDEVNHLFVGQESKDVLHTIAGPLLRGEFEMSDLWRKVKLDELPHRAHGPTRVVAATNTWRDSLNQVFDEGMSPLIGSISRTPMFFENFDTAMGTFEHVRNNMVIRGLDDEAKAIFRKVDLDPDELEQVHDAIIPHLQTNRTMLDHDAEPISRYAKAIVENNETEQLSALAELAGRPLNMSSDELATLRAWHGNLAEARKAQVEVAMKRATELTLPYVDDHRLRSVFQELMGPVLLPYFYAEEQFLRRFARSLYETPHLLRKGQLTMNGLRNVGVIQKDRYGNEYIMIPGSEILMGKVADVATMITGNEALQALDQPLGMRTDFVLPGWNTQQSRWGWGPLINLSVDHMTERYPEYEWRNEPPNRKWWEYVVPGPAAGAYKAFVQDIDPAQLASAQVQALAYMEAHGLVPDETATAAEKEQFLENLRGYTRGVGVLRYMTGQVGFTGMTPKDWKGDELSQEFQSLLASGLSVEDAFDKFVERYGMENVGYTIFATRNEVGAPLPATEKSLRFMLDNEEEIRNNPTAMAWLLPQEAGDTEFDRRAYNEQLALGLRSKKAPEEMLEQIYVKQASEKYFKMKDDYDSQRGALVEKRDAAKGGARKALQQQLNDMDDAWKSRKEAYFAMHPVFAESFSPEAKQRRQEVLTDLEWMVAAGMGGEQGEKIEPLVTAYWDFQREYSAIKGTSKAAKAEKAALLKAAFNEMWTYAEKNPEAMGFFTSVVRHELPDQADTLYTNVTEGKAA